MVNTAEQTARNAEAIDTNDVGLCLVWCRTRAGIDARYPTAAEAGLHADNLHRDRDVPRGAFAFWTGGSEGAGHIAIGLGDGLVRSTDADGPGRVATRPIGWFDTNWPALTWLGWADNVNGVTVPGVGDDMADAATQATLADIKDTVHETLSQLGQLRAAESNRAVSDRKRDAALLEIVEAAATAADLTAARAQIRRLKKLLLEHDAEEATP